MKAASLINSVRTIAGATAGALVVAMFLDGPLAPMLIGAVPFWSDSWIRIFLFVIVAGLAVLASLREDPRFLRVFLLLSLAFIVPSIYSAGSIDWLGLVMGGSKTAKAAPTQVIVALEMVLFTISLMAVLYLGWLRRMAIQSEEQGVDAEDLNGLTRASLRFVAITLGVTGGCAIIVALVAGNMAGPLLGLTTNMPLAVPVLGLAASLVLAASLYLGLTSRSRGR